MSSTSPLPTRSTISSSSRRSVAAAIRFGFSSSRELSQRFVDKNPKLGAYLNCEIIGPRVLKNGRLCGSGSGRGGSRKVERLKLLQTHEALLYMIPRQLHLVSSIMPSSLPHSLQSVLSYQKHTMQLLKVFEMRS